MNKEYHLLVIRLSAMGDVAMLVPVVVALTQQYPQLHLHILTQGLFASFFTDLPRVRVHVVEKRGKHRGLPGILRLAKEIPDRIDAIADVHNVLRSKILRRVLSMKGLKNHSLDKGRAEKKALTSTHHKVFKPLKSTHQRYAEVFSQLGFPVQLKPTHCKAKQPLPSPLRDQLQLGESEFLLGFAPFAAHRSKRMSVPKIEWLLQEIKAEFPKHVVLLFGGGNKEIEDLTVLAERFSNCKLIAGQFSFEDELNLIANLQLMLSMDSSNGHLAAMFGVPVLTFWGGTHPYAGFAPYLQPPENQFVPDLEKYPLLPISIYGNKMIEGYEDVMDSINYSLVIQRIKNLVKA